MGESSLLIERRLKSISSSFFLISTSVIKPSLADALISTAVSGGSPPRGGGGGGGGQTRPWGQEGVITPPFNPNDIAGTQGGGRPPVRIPVAGGGGFGEPQILNNRPGGRAGEWGPQPTGGGSTVPQTQPQGPGMWMDNPSAPGGRSWVGADFSSQPTQQGGGALRDLAGEAADAAKFGGSWQNGAWQPASTRPATSMPMAQAPQTLPMASAGLNSLSTKAKRPQNITLNQMYRK